MLEILLKDRTTNKNIIWANESYKDKELQVDDIENIKPRVYKSKETKSKRTKKKAEVFTPTWICKEQNDLIDEAYWSDKTKTWIDYVMSNRLEITCGEAPYLTSRYDATTGENIDLINRIGLLDRKLQLINKNVDNEYEWFNWVQRAYESTYGYEYQGDNLILARMNLYKTFVENFDYKFNKYPTLEQLEVIANIISWNIWQMDGITTTVPRTNLECKIYDWKTDKLVKFKDLLD